MINLKEVQQVLTSFRDMMGRPELMIVGSLSLHLNGFGVEVNDIDLELHYPSPKSIEKLNMLSEVNPSGVKNYSEQTDKRYDFIYHGIKFNVWLKSEGQVNYTVSIPGEEINERRYTWWNYYKVSNVVSTVKAMLQQGRSKDYKNLVKIVNQLIG